MERVVWVTAYCDASYSRAKGGAWAVWLTSVKGRVIRGGPCPAYVHDSGAAELAALYAAVYLACRTWPGEVRGIVVRGDCQSALLQASPDVKLARNEGVRRLQERLRLVLREHDVAIETQWVRGHQKPSTGTQAYLNDACDKLANTTRKLSSRRPPKPKKKNRK